MLSLDNCRSLLNSHSEEPDDADLESLRDQFYCIARLGLEVFARVGREKDASAFHDALTSFEQSERESIEERAALIEFEGKIDRERAERIAISQLIKDWNN
jgi:hypothetical protein